MRNERGSMLMIGAMLVGIIAIIGIYAVSKYNSFVSNEEKIDSNWAQIENQLQRRFDS